MDKNSIFKPSKFTKGFTLIELLVVVAIIGILSSVVITSLNSAREKGKIPSIKSTLKQLYNQAALNQLENGSFAGSNDGSLNCTGSNNNLAKIAQPLINQGIVVKCFSFYGASDGNPIYSGDNHFRFGATALIYDANELKAWSVDENGVVKWDQEGVNLDGVHNSPDNQMSWRSARDACSKSGGILPSLEETRSLSYAWKQASTTSFVPVGFSSGQYWTKTMIIPPPENQRFYSVIFLNGGYDYWTYTRGDLYVRCVR